MHSVTEGFLWLLIFVLKHDVTNLEMLGKHKRASLDTDAIGTRFPHPVNMFNHFIKPGKPLLMKAVLEEDYPAYTQWTDKYLKDEFGEETVSVWTEGLTEQRGMTLSQFIDVYQRSGFSVFDGIPDWMKDEVLIPPVLQCGGIQDNLHTPVLLFSNGGDKTKLHYNDVDYITCLLDGRQEFVLYDKKYKSLIEADGWDREGGYSLVDVEDVDENEFPGVFNTPWQKATVLKGDCLLVPYGWYQHVLSQSGRTLAILFRFCHLWWFDKNDCEDVDRNATLKPLSEFMLLDDIGKLRSPLLAPFANMSAVSKEAFRQTIDCGSTELTEEFWSYLDLNIDGSLSWQELYYFDMNYDQQKFFSCYRNHLHTEKQQKIFTLPKHGAGDKVTSEQPKARDEEKVRTKTDSESLKVKVDRTSKEAVVTKETVTGKTVKVQGYEDTDSKLDKEILETKKDEQNKEEKSGKKSAKKDESIHDEF